MQQLIVATRNRNKTREIQQILGPKFELRDLTAYAEISEMKENGKSFEENAKLKAIAVSKELSGLVIADDSGLEVAALNGAPGIYSARYAGDKATDKENIDRLLGELGRIGAQRDQRRAGFRCGLTLARNGELREMFERVVEGTIADQPPGSRGLGYDPRLLPRGLRRTFA